MKLRKTLALFSVLTVSTLVFFACSRDDKSASGDKARLQVFLTDDPASFDAIHIDIQDIKINYSNDTSGWQSLAGVNAGSYDILELVNDQDTLLADADVQTGRISQIRLVLGPNNYVTVNGVDYPLETPSAQQSGLKLNIHQDVNAGILYKLTLDFDGARSVVKTGNGKYILKPTIRTTVEAIGGSIKGFVLPSNIQTSVFAIQGPDTIAGTFTTNGAYFIKGLSAGSYNLAFVPSDTPTHYVSNLSGIIVNTNQVTVVDTLTLQP
ncbi:MAG TPA: DUF4382 domain-containing protein [Flavisolibacter sp.]